MRANLKQANLGVVHANLSAFLSPLSLYNPPDAADAASEDEDGVHGAPKAPSSVMKSNSAGAFKAHSANENDTALYTLVTNRPRGVKNFFDEVVVIECNGTNLGTSQRG